MLRVVLDFTSILQVVSGSDFPHIAKISAYFQVRDLYFLKVTYVFHDSYKKAYGRARQIVRPTDIVKDALHRLLAYVAQWNSDLISFLSARGSSKRANVVTVLREALLALDPVASRHSGLLCSFDESRLSGLFNNLCCVCLRESFLLFSLGGLSTFLPLILLIHIHLQEKMFCCCCTDFQLVLYPLKCESLGGDKISSPCKPCESNGD